MQLTYSLKRS